MYRVERKNQVIQIDMIDFWREKDICTENTLNMKKSHPIMIMGHLIYFFMLIYGGEKAAQKNPLGFTAFFGGAMILSVVGIIAIVCY